MSCLLRSASLLVIPAYFLFHGNCGEYPCRGIQDAHPVPYWIRLVQQFQPRGLLIAEVAQR